MILFHQSHWASRWVVLQHDEVTYFFKFALGMRGFLETNMLVVVMQNTRIGSLVYHEAQTQYYVIYISQSTILKAV